MKTRKANASALGGTVTIGDDVGAGLIGRRALEIPGALLGPQEERCTDVVEFLMFSGFFERRAHTTAWCWSLVDLLACSPPATSGVAAAALDAGTSTLNSLAGTGAYNHCSARMSSNRLKLI